MKCEGLAEFDSDQSCQSSGIGFRLRSLQCTRVRGKFSTDEQSRSGCRSFENKLYIKSQSYQDNFDNPASKVEAGK